ncbi:hypothetical protein Acr_00g0031010 [Actinidia rufa]|uniref:Uncharacterized protein n=1 Tax=Actinidia rufa TaxID=165716 RepID=A0A7J0DEZ9_9ERIC|nr:hypothetical protein Acr_00g0031010 [Actinidia rufa]
MHLCSRCLPRPSASSPLDNRACPMANTSQAPDLEGLHREIHGMAEQMRIMNENNARLLQLLANNLPRIPPALVPENHPPHRPRWSGMPLLGLRATTVLIEPSDNGLPPHILSEKRVPPQSLDHLAKF